MPVHDHAMASMQYDVRALVIEDEERYRAFLVETLEDLGCRAVGMPNVMSAREWLREETPDVLLLDLNLPVVDGMTFLESFRQEHRDIPVIILTGVGDLETAQKAIRHGITEFLTKPCHLGTLEAAVDRARRVRAEKARDNPDPEPGKAFPEPDDRRSLAEIECEAIRDALRRNLGNRTVAAQELGISRRTLYNRLEQYRLQGLEGFD